VSKLTKAQAKLHDQACARLEKDVLTLVDREYVLQHWRADAHHDVQRSGSFFTPTGLAGAFAMECTGAQSVIDLCAGIGSLSYWRWHRDQPRRLVCVEANPAYVAVGKKVLPEAEWICADVFALPDPGRFELAISNPPFGRANRNGKGPRYRGSKFEYHVIDLASTLAEQGVFLIPRTSAPFSSHKGHWRRVERDEYLRFQWETGILLGEGVGVEPDGWLDEWHGVKPEVESVRVEFAVKHLMPLQRML
jgi:hypothetical protein